MPATKRRPLWRILRRVAMLLCIVGLIVFVAAFLTSPRFAVQKVDAIGLDVTTPDEIAPVQETLMGQNWARARVGDAAKRLEALPAVREAEVARVLAWPPRLQIRLHEREPLARVGAGRIWWVVDEEGVPFRRMDEKSPADRALLALTGPGLDAPRRGVTLSPAMWKPARRMVAALQNDGEWKLRRVYFDRTGAASLRLAGGPQKEMLVQLGTEGWERKLKRARQALAYFAATRRPAASLDLVSYNRPVWTARAPQITRENASDGQNEGFASRDG